MGAISEVLTRKFGFVMGKAAERKISERLAPERLIGETFADEYLEADQSYFQITLSEMFISKEREYWNTFLPFVLMLAEFTYDGEIRQVPVFAGQDFKFLESIQKYIRGESVEYKNIPLIGPVPYAGGGIRLFMGLFRALNEDLSGRIFDVVNTFSRLVPIANLSGYMALAAPLEKGISSILGIKDVQLRIGVAQEIRDSSVPGRTPASFSVLINATQTSGKLWVKEGELWTGADEPKERFTEADYCLFRLDFPRERSVADLPFAKMWNQIKAAVWQNEAPRAQALLLELCRQLAVSPDLTVTHRFQLVGLYKVNLEREIELWNKTVGSAQPSRGGVNKGSSGMVSGKAAVQQILTVLSPKSGVRKNVSSLTANWDSLMQAWQPHDSELTDAVLKRQITALGSCPVTAGDVGELLKGLERAVIR